MPGRHCTDQQLISFHDGALNPLLRVWVSRHLNNCWRCFSRMRDLGQLEEDLAGAWRMSGPVPQMDGEAARAEFAAWAASSGVRFETKSRAWPRTHIKAAFAAGFGAVALIAGAAVWRLERPEPSAPVLRPSTPSRATALTSPVTVVARHPVVETVTVPLDAAKPAAPRALAGNPGPSDEQLLETELGVWWILHRSGACRGEPIEPGIAGRKVLVTGMAPSSARKAYLMKLLSESSGHEWLRIEIASPDERPSKAQAAYVAPAPEPESQMAPLSDHAAVSRAAVAALRIAHPAEDDNQARQRLVHITRASVHAVEESITEAWAIRRLQERFMNPDVHLSPQSRVIVEAMLREHLLALQTNIAALGRTLNPILSHMSWTSPGSTPETLFETVDRLRTLVEAAFAGDAEPLGTPDRICGEIAGLSRHLSEDLSHPDDLAGRIFPATATQNR